MAKRDWLPHALVGAGFACLNLPDAFADDVKEKSIRLETITIIGEKTERSLQETTSSVTVVPEERFSSLQYKSVHEAISDVSNLVTVSGSVPDIRGVSGNGAAGGFNSISGGANPRVSTLIDGVAEPFVADLTGDSGLWDIEQIEVFRGPQSTSNGRNSIGGSIIIKTKDPSFDWESGARLGYRNEEQYVDAAAMLSGPIVDDTLAFRISAERLDGQTLTNDQEYETNPANYDLNELISQRVRTKLLWTPSDKLETLLTYSANNESGDTGRIYYTADDPWQYNRIYFRDIESDADTTSLRVGYEFSDFASIDILAAYMNYVWGFDSYEPAANSQQQLAFDEDNSTLDAKMNLGSVENTFYGFIGLAYFERNQDILSSGAFDYSGDDKSESEALYGELNYATTDALTLVFGSRVQRESQLRNFTMGDINSVLDQDKTITLPKLAVLYDWSENTTLGFSARKGYNPAGGALNFTAGEYYYYDEETVDTYETSLRSSLADGKVSFSANLFYNEYEGYQALSSTRFIVNMNEVVTYGAELETLTQVTSNFELGAGFGLLKTKIKDAGEEYPDANGNELNNAPKITANLSAKYWINYALSVGANANYVDDYFGDFDNTEERIAGGYTLVGLNMNYEIDNWLVSAFVNNLFDEKAFQLREPPGGRYPSGYVAIVEPRNVGLSVTYSM